MADLNELDDSKMSMNLISREDLRDKLDRKDKFKLVSALGEWAFEAKPIPGSINISNMRDAIRCLILAMILSYIVLIHYALRV